MGSKPSNDPVIQQLQLLLTGYGYNFYSATNQARADDQLVRERASYHLAQASDMLARLRADYHNRFIPPLTRANPDPPQEAMAQIRRIDPAVRAIVSSGYSSNPVMANYQQYGFKAAVPKNGMPIVSSEESLSICRQANSASPSVADSGPNPCRSTSTG